MTKKLSEHLAELSVRTKKIEDAVAAAQTVAREGHGPPGAGACWSAVKAKIAADRDALKASVAQAKHDLDVKSAEKHAERLESEADFAIDYAIASIEQAGFAAIDAIAGRVKAEQVKRG